MSLKAIAAVALTSAVAGDVKFITREMAEAAVIQLDKPINLAIGTLPVQIRTATGRKSGKQYTGVFNQSGDFLGFAKAEFKVNADGTMDKSKILGFDITLTHIGVMKTAVDSNGLVKVNGIVLQLKDTESQKTGKTYTGVYDTNGERVGVAYETSGGQVIMSLNVYFKK